MDSKYSCRSMRLNSMDKDLEEMRREYYRLRDLREEKSILRYVGRKIGMLYIKRAILNKNDPHYHMLEYGIIQSHNSHGMYDHKLYYTYMGMKSRCYNKNNPKYNNYGGRGIYICDEWLEEGEGNPGFKAFMRWAYDYGFYDQPKDTPRPEVLTIDRIDNNGPYAPWNCRWVTTEVQENNKRTNKHIWYNGKKYTYMQFCKLFNVEFINMYYYISRGLSLNLMVYNFIHKDRKIYYHKSDNTYRDSDGFQHLLPRYDVRLLD